MEQSEQRDPAHSAPDDARVVVENLGGIDRCEVAFGPGVTVFTGRNATNRTSLLRSIAGGLGGSAATLKGDADAGSVELSIDGKRATREYVRRNGRVDAEGEGYLGDEDLVDLFACLLEHNPIRRAVESGDDLRALLMRPVDTDEIEREIADLESERARVDERLTEIDRERDRLPKLEERRRNLREDLESVEAELDDARGAVENLSVDREEAERAEELLSELEELTEALEEPKSEIETQRSIRRDLEERRSEVEAELAGLAADRDELGAVESEIDRLEALESELTGTISDLSAIVNRNDALVSGDQGAARALTVDDDAGVAGALDPMSETVECWTCGSRVERSAIADRMAELRDLIETKREERTEVREDLEERKARRSELRSAIDRREDLEVRLDEIESEIDRRAEEIDALEDDLGELREERAEVRAAVDDVEELRETDLLGAYERLSELEYERGRLEGELSDVDDEIAETEYLVGKRETLEARRESVADRITDLRSRIDDLETETVERFDGHMNEVLGLLEYERIERVWIERLVDGGESTFELHVVRETAEGAVYEDTVDHLSESEREVVGLVVALAGYLAHEVHESVPLMLLDSLEAIDADRIRELVAYFADYPDYLLVALLPEDAAALPEGYERIPAERVLT